MSQNATATPADAVLAGLGDLLPDLEALYTDVHAHPELKRKLYSALAEGDEGELSIAIPDNTVRASGRGSVAGFGSDGACFLWRLLR